MAGNLGCLLFSRMKKETEYTTVIVNDLESEIFHYTKDWSYDQWRQIHTLFYWEVKNEIYFNQFLTADQKKIIHLSFLRQQVLNAI
jgi:hypothetical protein